MKNLRRFDESTSESYINNVKSSIEDLKNDLYNHCLDVIDISKSSEFKYFTTAFLIELSINVEYDKMDKDTFDSFKAKLNLLGNNTVNVIVSCGYKGRIGGGKTSKPMMGLNDLEYSDISVDDLITSLEKSYGKDGKQNYERKNIVNSCYIDFIIRYVKLSDLR